jgi:hypothetical protein
VRATIDSEIHKLGWQRHEEKDAEITDPWSRVEHNYFAVAHREV